MKGRLLLGDDTELELFENVPFPSNFSIADVKEPNKRQRSYTATIDIPGSASNLAYFISAYSLTLTVENGTFGTGYDFDHTKLEPVRYFKGSVQEFKGALQLNDVTLHNKEYTLNITLHSEVSALLLKLKDVYVSEFDWSTYNHVLNRSNIKKSWDTSVVVNGVDTSNFTAGKPLGFGYLYPLVNYGYPQISPTTFKTFDLIPQVYVREIALKCLELAQMSMNSDWLDSNRMRAMTLGYGGGERVTISAAVAAQRAVSIVGDYDQTLTKQYNLYNPVSQRAYYSFVFGKSIISNPDFVTSATPTDPLGQYDESTGKITIAQTGTYSFTLTGDIAIAVDSHGMVLNTEQGFCQLYIRRNGAAVPTTLLAFPVGATSIPLALSGSLYLNSGDVVEMWLHVSLTKGYDAATVQDAVAVDMTFTETGLIFDLTAVNTTLTDGDTVELSRFIPEMKADTFMAGVIEAFNLYVSDPDPDAEVIAEPLTEYYEPTDVFDRYDDIIDLSKPILISPTAEIEGKVYRFEFEADDDYDNKRYFERFGSRYGNRSYQVENAFVTGDRVYKLPFAQSVPVDIVGTSLVIPRIIQFDESTGVVKPYKGKPRLYFYNGLKSGSWRLLNTIDSSFEDQTTYPCVHHFDDKDDPTFDFNWQLPELLFYAAAEVTTANLFSEYHETFIREVTGRDARIVRLYVKYTSRDVANLRFRRLKSWNNVRYRLNLVSDFDSDTAESTLIELVKVLRASNPKRFRFKKPGLSFGGSTSPVVTGGHGVDEDAPVVLGGLNSVSSNSSVKYG